MAVVALVVIVAAANVVGQIAIWYHSTTFGGLVQVGAYQIRFHRCCEVEHLATLLRYPFKQFALESGNVKDVPSNPA